MHAASVGRSNKENTENHPEYFDQSETRIEFEYAMKLSVILKYLEYLVCQNNSLT